MRRLKLFSANLFSVLLLVSLWAQASFGVVGVYTCSCDPVTNAHLAIMRAAVSEFDVEKLFVMVNASGTKVFKSSAKERIGLIRQGLGPEAMARVELFPVHQKNKNSVIAGLAVEHGSLITFLGEDSYLSLPAQERDSVARQWVVIPRSDKRSPGLDRSNVQILDLKGLLRISSTELRRQLQGGEVSPDFTSRDVLQEISRRKLYKALPLEIDSIQKGLFNDAFTDFRVSLSSKYSEKTISEIPAPPYDPLSSREAWADQFVSEVIGNLHISPEMVDSLSNTCHETLYETSSRPERLKDFFYIEKDPIQTSTAPVAAKGEQVGLKNFAPELYNIDVRSYVGERFPETIKDLVV